MRIKRTFFATALLLALGMGSASAVDYETQIKPIFENNCIDCHGPDKDKSGLRVDRRAILIRGGDSGAAAIVPGEPAKSLLLDMIKGVDPDEVMPPKGDPLKKSEIALIEKWVTEGAKWPGQMNEVAKLTTDHWSFQPVSTSPDSGSQPSQRSRGDIRQTSQSNRRFSGRKNQIASCSS